MRFAALVVASVLSARTARAAPVIGGASLTLAPDARDGGLDLWLARTWPTLFVGGGLGLDTLVRERGELAVTYEVLAGARLPLATWLSALGDAGVGISQNIDGTMPILVGQRLDFDTIAVAPRGRLRLQLVARVSPHTHVSLAATAHSTPGGDAARAGLGVGFVFAL